MNIRLLGAVLIIIVCGGFGFRMASAHRTDLLYLRDLISILDYMECELNYRLTPLPKLCRNIAKEHPKTLGPFFLQLADIMDSQICADVSTCVNATLEAIPPLPYGTSQAIRTLGKSLGCYDLEGQLKGLQAARADSRRAYESLNENKDARLRSYQVLGICAGAAVTIVLI
jgi:stage III sporulation protein AB